MSRTATHKLSHEERLRLMRFLCSFAWCDLEVHEKEKKFIRRMVKELALDAAEKKQVEGWIALPPRATEVDPAEIPREHRKLFLDACRAVVMADGEIHPQEQINLALLQELLQ